MYEIWLIINTFYELALMNLGLVVSTLIIWIALMAIAAKNKTKCWCSGIKPAALVAIVVWVIAFMLIPGITKSSFADVTYIVDYMVVAGVALACAGIVGAFVWPIYLIARR